MMITCRDCGSREPPGTLYCAECGACLLEEEVTFDGTLLPFADATSAVAEPPLLGQDLNPVIGAKSVTFVIPSSGRRVKLPLEGDILIGRADPSSQAVPELDLTADDGVEMGISRLHATINPSEEGVVLIDMGSTNGTLLNNYRLPPDLPYPLHSGDEVRFGHLLVHIFFD